jgi:hypothetical protein
MGESLMLSAATPAAGAEEHPGFNRWARLPTPIVLSLAPLVRLFPNTGSLSGWSVGKEEVAMRILR